jgi:putative ABC transport system substrate-binding protein
MRNKILVCLLSTALLLTGAFAEAQQVRKVARIGFLDVNFPSTNADRYEAFRRGLRELGYVEGENIVIDHRYAEGKLDHVPELAAELVREKIDLLVTPNAMVAQEAKKLTAMIPIVIVGIGDPIGNGLVNSLARPGANVTGLSSLETELSGKRLELLKEAFPKITHVAVLWNPSSPTNAFSWKETQAAAIPLALQLQSLEVRKPDDFERAFRAAATKYVEGLITLRDVLTNVHRKEIIAFAVKNRLPAIYANTESAEEGGLMSYAPDFRDIYRRAAVYVDKILKGAKPADLPVEQPTKFEFVINLKTAKQIGLTIPQSVLYRADRVIR